MIASYSTLFDLKVPMMRSFFCGVIFCLTSFPVIAQLPPSCAPGQPPADECSDACIYCNFNGYIGNTSGYTAGTANGFCGNLDNEQWLGFIAGATAATFTATPSNCQTGDGIQIALYETCDGNPLDCAGGMDNGGNVPVVLNDVPLNPGTNYFLLVDGFGGDQCTFTISVDPPFAVIAPPIGANIGPIAGPGTVCPGSVLTYSVPMVANAGAYTWTVPNGWLINGQPSPQQILATADGNTVEITFGTTSGQICVSAANSCYPNGPSTCRNIIVAPIPPTVLTPVVICNEDAPYDLPWGEQAPASGLYEATLHSLSNCDSIVRQMVTIQAPLITNLIPKTICAGEHVTICETDYFDGGVYAHICESSQGCDSVVNFAITVLDPVAEILGNGAITCTNNSVLLTAAPSPNITIFNWRNLAGQFLGSSNTLLVTNPGTYILNASMSGGGIQCVKADTIQILANTTPPSLQASGGTLNCTTFSVPLVALSNAVLPTWSWSGPGNFSASIPNPVVTALGTYTVTVSNSVNGCTASTSVLVDENTAPPEVETFGATLSCAITSAQITAISNPATASYQWSGPNNFAADIQTPTATGDGLYTVTVTNVINHCTSSGTAVVTLNTTPPGANATALGSISCASPEIVLEAGPTTPGNTFLWSGPNNFSSNNQTSPVSTSGTYTVVVRGANGCTSTASTLVQGDTLPPNAAAMGGIINCGTPNISISGTSTTSGATFAWAGPAGFASMEQNPLVSELGIYTLTVTGPNTCWTTATATITGDYDIPNASANGGVITCSQNSTTISGSSSTGGATLEWNGPGGFISNLPAVSVSTVGEYILTATGLNGCTATATAVVLPDANVPNATADGGVLNCVTDTVTIHGASTSPGVTLLWSGPNNFSSVETDPFVSINGIYILVVTDPANGCTAQASASVTLDLAQPAIQIQTDTLTCATTSLDLAATTSTSNAQWDWIGPGNFQSSSQSPAIQLPGTYSLTVTNLDNGCTNTANTVVALDLETPVAASDTGILTCMLDSLVLNASASLPAAFVWKGPNGFSFTGNNPVVVHVGDYTLIATALRNGCSDTSIVSIGQDIQTPGASASGNTIDCNTPQVSISAQSALGVSYSWDGPGAFDQTLQNPVVNAGGTFTVTVTGPNGCTSSAEAIVALDTEPPSIVAVANDFITCFAPSVNIQTNITSVSTLLGSSWTGPNNYFSSDEDPLVFEGGAYTIVATSQNGCTSTLQVIVQEDTAIPDVSAVGGTLTCADTSIQLDGSSQTLGTFFVWSGPNNFSAMEEDPKVELEGVYTVVVTSQNGCSNATQTTVDKDVSTPDATAISSNNLNCQILTANLIGNSVTPGVQFTWSGPNNFKDTTAIVQIQLPGLYTLSVEGANGCISTSSIEILQDVTDPDADALGGTVDCISGEINLSGISATNGATFTWAGPSNFYATIQNPIATEPGLYILTVTGSNGCTALASATVNANTETPDVSISGAGVLTCAETSLLLTSDIQTPGATGVWTGPGNFIANSPDASISLPGTYVFTVTAQNGCVSAPELQISQDILPPQNVTATGGLLNCTFPSIMLDAGSSSEVSYFWSGPGNFTSPLHQPVVTNPGVYTVTLTGLANGCTSSASTSVTQDPTVPDIAVTADTITCHNATVTLEATTLTSGVTFQWSGPNNFLSTLEDPQTGVPGIYQVIATAQSGCTATFNFNVNQDIVSPLISAAGDTITCIEPSGQLFSQSNTIGVNYTWTGPDGFSSNQAAPVVTIAGSYEVTATAPNGCTATTQVLVVPNNTPPVISASGGTISCLSPSVTLSATAALPVSWEWTGPASFTSNLSSPVVSIPGNYVLQGRAENGCISTQTALVTADTLSPNISTETPDILDCNTAETSFRAFVAGGGPFEFSWSTQNGVISNGANSPIIEVTQAGDYYVQVINLSNGCSATAVVTVLENSATPSGAGLLQKHISCFGETDGALQVDSIQGGTPPYIYSIDNQPFSPNNTFSGLTPGSHALVVQDANGCEYLSTFFIEEPEAFKVNLGPDTTIHLGTSIELTLDDITTDPDRVVTTIVTPTWLLLPDTLTPGYSFNYQVAVIDSNGCRAEDVRFVIVDRERWVFIPNIFSPDANDNNLFKVFGGEDVASVESFMVFDRWGNALHDFQDFQPGDPAADWDGRYKGEPMNPGVYAYFAKILFKDGETQVFKGDVTLIR